MSASYWSSAYSILFPRIRLASGMATGSYALTVPGCVVSAEPIVNDPLIFRTYFPLFLRFSLKAFLA